MRCLTDGLDLRLQVRKLIGELMAPRIDPELFRLSRDYVGDTAETVALLWPESGGDAPAPTLGEIVAALDGADTKEVGHLLEAWLDLLDATGRWALLKLVTGGLRVGVSGRLAKTAAGRVGGVDAGEIEELWFGLAPPYRELFAWLEGRAPKPDIGDRAVFRPLMLAHPLEDGDLDRLDPQDFSAEWKWDGIRVQLVARGDEVRLFSRTGDDIARAFSRHPRRALGRRGARRRASGHARRHHRAVQRPAAAPQPQDRGPTRCSRTFPPISASTTC